MTTSAEALAIGGETIGATHPESEPVRYLRGTRRAIRPGRLARLVGRLQAGSLDRQLINGADPSNSPKLAARAAGLTTPHTRALIAGGLERLLEVAQSPSRRWSAVGRGEPLLANAEEICELAELLRGSAPLQARGVAIVNRFLTDGTGPAYHGGHEEIASQLREARLAMQD
jgi:hypothetical protein